MNCLAQCLPVDCTQGAAFIMIVGLMIHHQDSALMVIGHLLGAKETGRENQLFLSTYSVPGLYLFSFSSVQSLTHVWLFETAWTVACQASLTPTPGVYSNSLPLSRWCHPTISSSVIPFSSCLQSFTASGSFPMSQFFASGCQSIGVSASASVLPVNIQDWFPLGWTGWISLQSKGLSRVFSSTTIQKHQFFTLSFLYYFLILLFIYLFSLDTI